MALWMTDEREAAIDWETWVEGVDFRLCRRCGRALWSKDAVEAGIGAKCAMDESRERAEAQRGTRRRPTLVAAAVPLGRYGVSGKKARHKETHADHQGPGRHA